MELDINLTSSCRITVLLVPIYPIKRSVFSRYVELIREFSTIRLNDVTPGNTSELAAFNNINFQQGQIHFRFTTHYSGRDNLIDFQPHRRLFGVIGIIDCQEWKDRPLKNGYQQYLGSLDKYYSSIVTRCFGFDPTENQPDDTKGLIMIPDVGDKKFYMATLLSDFASDILAQFSVLVKETGHQLQSEPLLRDTNYASSPRANQRHSVLQQPYPSTAESTSRHSVSSINLTSSSSSSPSSSPGTGHSSRMQKRAPGRIKKLYADFYLLSGRLPDARSLYIQAIDMTKITSDHLWLASAMEGYVCTTLLLEQLQPVDEAANGRPSTPGTSSSMDSEAPPSLESTPTISFVLDHYHTILQLYSEDIRNSTYRNMKYTTNESSTNALTTTSTLVYAEACIKVARFLLTVYLNGKLDYTSLFLLVQGCTSSLFGQFPIPSTSSPSLSPSLPETPISMNHPSTLKQQKPLLLGDCSIERRDIGRWTTRIWEAYLEFLTVADQIYLMTEMAFIYSSIGYYRKAAWIKYRSIQLLLPILLHRQTKSNQDTKGDNTIKAFPNIDRQSILAVLQRICKAYSIVGFDPQGDYVFVEKQAFPATLIDATNRKGCTVIGWPSLQLIILRKCIIAAESLHAYDDMFYYASTLMKNLYQHISKEEQIRLSNTIQRIGALHRNLSLPSLTAIDNENDCQEQGVNYWGVNIVTSITAIQSISRKLLHPHALSKETIRNTISATTSPNHGHSPDSSATTNNDPFIYNPYTQKKNQKEQILLIKDEIAEFQVSLANPFGFDLELQNIQLRASGVSFHAIPHSTTLPAYGTSKLCISGIPADSGTLHILGCTIKIVGFAEQEFLLDQRALKNQELITVDQTEFNVVDAQPLLKVKSTSLLQGAIMLFEGERAQVKITLENIGNTPVDFMVLSFEDDSLDNYILDCSPGVLGSDLSMEQQYELERVSNDRKVFMRQGNIRHNDQMIGENVWLPPGDTLDISLDIYGRRGCTQGTIKLDYGYLHGNNNYQDSQQFESSTMFYMRQLYIPILITVYCHLKPQYWNLLYIQLEDVSRYKNMDPKTCDTTDTATLAKSNTRQHNANSIPIEQVLKTVAYKQQPDANSTHTVSGSLGRNEYCLATVDVQNRWSFPFRVIFSIDNADGDTVMDVDSIIQPGTTTRILLPVRRFTLPDGITSRPITLETQKQFVVVSNQVLPTSISLLSLAEQKNYWKSQLELFWYREDLLGRIKARWVKYDMDDIKSDAEDEINRQGELDLRTCLRLTSEQLSILKVPDVTFTLTLEGCGVKKVGFKHFVCQSGERVLLTVFVFNRYLKTPTRFILRVQSIQNLNGDIKELDLSQNKLLMEGMNQVVLPEIPLDQQGQHTIPLYFLAKGRFEFLYHVQDVVTKKAYYDQENTVVDVVDIFD